MTAKDDAVSSLPPEVRAELIKAGVPFPGETPDEAACRFRREFDILTEEELAAGVGLGGGGADGVRTLREWRGRGEDPEHIKVGRMIFYPREAVAAWLIRRGEQGGTMWPRSERAHLARGRGRAA
jgi:hypothetical protein